MFAFVFVLPTHPFHNSEVFLLLCLLCVHIFDELAVPLSPSPAHPHSIASSCACAATAFVLFLQVIPFSITSFEVEKWMVEDHHRRAAAVTATISEPPSTPSRELSGRWVADRLPSPPLSLTDCSGGCGTTPAAEPSTPMASTCLVGATATASGSGLEALARTSLSRISGSDSTTGSNSGGGGGDGRGAKKLGARGGLAWRRVGGGVVTGAGTRGWAPATPLDSPVASSDGGESPLAMDQQWQAAMSVEVEVATSTTPSLQAPAIAQGALLGNPLNPHDARRCVVGADRDVDLVTESLRRETQFECGEKHRPPLSPTGPAVASGPRGAIPVEQSTLPGPAAMDAVLTPGLAVLASLDRAASAPCPSGIDADVHGGDAQSPKPGPTCDMDMHRWPEGREDSNAPYGTHVEVTSGSLGSGYAALTAPKDFAFRTPAVGAGGAAVVAAKAMPEPPGAAPHGPVSGPRRGASGTSPQLHDMQHVYTLPPSPLPSATSPSTAATATSGRPPSLPLPSAGAGPLLRPRRVPSCLPPGRASIGNCPPVAGGSTVAERHTGHQPSGTGCTVAATMDMQRLSLPAHWPPTAIEGTLEAAVVSSARLPAPLQQQPSPPLARRLLNPVAVACSDLPVPQVRKKSVRVWISLTSGTLRLAKAHVLVAPEHSTCGLLDLCTTVDIDTPCTLLLWISPLHCSP